VNEPISFRKKPVEIQAMRFDGSTGDCAAVYAWVESCIGSVDPYSDDLGVSIDPEDGRMFIRTLEGDMKVSLGDWVIRGGKGEFYPCKPDIFEQAYEKV
jgi:hypothetical protein